MKRAKLLATITLTILTFLSCRNDDGNIEFVPARDRGEEVAASTAIIEDYLQTHFYNYEEFETPPADFDFKIRFDTIAGDNSDKISLFDHENLNFKMVPDRVDDGVEYKLYYLNVSQGGGTTSPEFPDITVVTYEGTWINEENATQAYTNLFDSSVVPVTFDLTGVVNGFQDAMIEFNVAESITANPDGSVTANDPGIGAVFMPSGLGYYVSTPQGSGIPVYAQLIFTFHLYQSRQGDQDNDGIPSIFEDLNMNQLEEDDDTDSDGLPNFFDADDDNDGRPTSGEIVSRQYINETNPTLLPNEFEINREIDDETGDLIVNTVEYIDANNNGVWDHLDDDI
ncbi:hypothetical protein POV27_20220 [Aureisphaera galaxeae]|uniref:FKBP-type peptidyl-prolyl cis-trans isomerase n=1 Tax=Aureisphaera galaxeae TaxID=1538023 RepID=UPI00234FDE10|nr:hypothetical protein [Aureisphaera galaxeae]MDC8006390.1 hypothetical protein [Aureisphaera galaxeae]